MTFSIVVQDPLVAALDLQRPITPIVLERAIEYHQAQADIHLANVNALQKALHWYKGESGPNPALQESGRLQGGDSQS